MVEEETSIDKTAENMAKSLDKESGGRRISFAIPDNMKMPIAWMIVFALIGIIIQSLQTKQFVFFRFFFSNYAAWFASLGNFVQPQVYSSGTELLKNLASGWYYFFFTGGLLSLVWAIISWILNVKVQLKERN